MSYDQVGLELVKVVATALFTAFLVRLVEHRYFIRGKWWERQEEAYSSVIDALVAFRHTAGAVWVAMVAPEDSRVYLDMGKKDKYYADYVEAGIQLVRVAASGNYFISQSAVAALKGLEDKLPAVGEEPRSESEWAHLLELTGRAAEECLEVVRDEAKKDLQVKWYKWW